MTVYRHVGTLAAAITALILLAGAAAAQADSEVAGLEKLKALVGVWEGQTKEGKSARATYELVSNGTAVLETLETGEEETMITVYHADGDQLMLTHYCGAGNQPRMRAGKAAAGTTLRFSFVDATNLQGAQAGHMHNLELKFEGLDRLIQVWTWREKGSEREEVIELARKR
ncbi:MAG: hypothetical protein V3U98_07615 [Acidobacteriota bacterium]